LRDLKDKEEEGNGHHKPQKPKLTLTFLPPISPSFGSSSSSSNAASSSRLGSSSNYNGGGGGGGNEPAMLFLRHARSGLSLCTGPRVILNLSEADPALRTLVTAVAAHSATGVAVSTGDGLLIPPVDGSTDGSIGGMNNRVNIRRKLAGFGIMKGMAKRAEKLLGQRL
jgi:hypothetical protein